MSQNLSVAFIIPIRTEQRSRLFPPRTHSKCLVCGIRNALYTTFILVMTFWQTLEYECDRECVWIRACCWLENEEPIGLLVCMCSAIACWRTSHLATWHNATLPNKPISCHSHLCLIFIVVNFFCMSEQCFDPLIRVICSRKPPESCCYHFVHLWLSLLFTGYGSRSRIFLVELKDSKR